ncbi:MAG TPA: DUF3099 domain-containing protein [Jatrophihabitantaceae bacterium]
MRNPREDHPTLITDAPESLDDEFDRRRKRYAIMMSLRALCVIGAALLYRVSWILAVVLIVGGAVLPWCAVILANDRAPKKSRRRKGYRHDGPAGKTLESRQKVLPPAREDQTVEGTADDPTDRTADG